MAFRLKWNKKKIPEELKISDFVLCSLTFMGITCLVCTYALDTARNDNQLNKFLSIDHYFERDLRQALITSLIVLIPIFLEMFFETLVVHDKDTVKHFITRVVLLLNITVCHSVLLGFLGLDLNRFIFLYAVVSSIQFLVELGIVLHYFSSTFSDSIWNLRYSTVIQITFMLGTLTRVYSLMFPRDASLEIFIAFCLIASITFFALFSTFWIIDNYNNLRLYTSTSSSTPAIQSHKYPCAFVYMSAILAEVIATLLAVYHFNETEGYEDNNSSVRLFNLADAVVLTYIRMVFTVFVLGVAGWYARMESISKNADACSKRTFVRFVSHEIRSPLNTIALGLNLLNSLIKKSDALTEEDTERNDTINEIKQSSDVAVRILNDLLTYDRLDQGSYHMEMKSVKAVEYFNKCIRKYLEQAKLSDYNFIYQIDNYNGNSMGFEDRFPNIYISADEVKLSLVIETLIANAVKFSPIGSNIVFKINLLDTRQEFVCDADLSQLNCSENIYSSDSTISSCKGPQADVVNRYRTSEHNTKQLGVEDLNGFISILKTKSFQQLRKRSKVLSYPIDLIRFTVIDAGKGIDPRDVYKVFNGIAKFDPGDLHGVDNLNAGLGLYISKSIVELHNGSLGCHSDGIDLGSSFYFNLPYEKKFFTDPTASIRRSFMTSSETQKLSTSLNGLVSVSSKLSPDRLGSPGIFHHNNYARTPHRSSSFILTDYDFENTIHSTGRKRRSCSVVLLNPDEDCINETFSQHLITSSNHSLVVPMRRKSRGSSSFISITNEFHNSNTGGSCRSSPFRSVESATGLLQQSLFQASFHAREAKSRDESDHESNHSTSYDKELTRRTDRSDPTAKMSQSSSNDYHLDHPHEIFYSAQNRSMEVKSFSKQNSILNEDFSNHTAGAKSPESEMDHSGSLMSAINSNQQLNMHLASEGNDNAVQTGQTYDTSVQATVAAADLQSGSLVSSQSLASFAATLQTKPSNLWDKKDKLALVVDDSVLNRKMLLKTIKLEGFVCTEACDGDIAIELVGKIMESKKSQAAVNLSLKIKSVPTVSKRGSFSQMFRRKRYPQIYDINSASTRSGNQSIEGQSSLDNHITTRRKSGQWLTRLSFGLKGSNVGSASREGFEEIADVVGLGNNGNTHCGVIIENDFSTPNSPDNGGGRSFSDKKLLESAFNAVMESPHMKDNIANIEMFQKSPQSHSNEHTSGTQSGQINDTANGDAIPPIATIGTMDNINFVSKSFTLSGKSHSSQAAKALESSRNNEVMPISMAPSIDFSRSRVDDEVLPDSTSQELPEYDIILMDFVMERVNGPEAARKMREMGYTGLIFGVTGNALPSDIAYYLESGADAVLTKPLDISLFLKTYSEVKHRKTGVEKVNV